MASAEQSTGYGLRRQLMFSGNPQDFIIWETRFTNYLYTKDIKIYKAILPDEDEGTGHADSNRMAYAELVQALDERSLQLIMTDAANDGRKALKLLKEHYVSTEKPRVLSLYEELTTLRLADTEDITGYLIRAERASTGLRTAGETISDNLIIAMILKGLPEAYKSFVVVHTQLDKTKTLTEFKSALNTYTHTEAMRSGNQNSVLAIKTPQHASNHHNNYSNSTQQCFSCGMNGHQSRNCRNKSQLFCNYCNSPQHVESVCFKKKKDARQLQGTQTQNTTTANVSTSSFSFICANTDKAYNVHTQSFNNKLLVDCGATAHMVNNADRFTSYDTNFDPRTHYVELADGQRSNELVTAKGQAVFQVSDSNGIRREITLHNALLAPKFPTSLFSVRAAVEKGALVNFSQTSTTLSSGDTQFNIIQEGKLYFLQTDDTAVYTTKTLDEWHKTLGHMNNDDILQLETRTRGMTVGKSSITTSRPCTTCLESKSTRKPKSVDDPPIYAVKPLERVHTDVAGPIDPRSREGFRYIINFVDEYSSMIFVYFLRSKDESHTALKQFIADVSPIGHIKEIHSDNGGEYLSEQFRDVLIENRIKQTTTASHTPYQNGKAERSWRSLLDMARCLLTDANLSKPFWTYSVRHAQYLRNRSYQRRTQSTAYELFTNIKPDMSKVHAFGSPCTYYNESYKQKLDARGFPGYYLGINTRNHSYYVLTSARNKIVTTRNATIHKEDSQSADESHTDEQEEYDPPFTPTVVIQDTETQPEPVVADIQPANVEVPDRPQRERRPNPKYADFYMSAKVDYAYTAIPLIPNTYEEAVSSEHAEHWKAAMDKEVTTLYENNTWDVTPLPSDRTETKGRWVYALKQSKTPGEVQYKARYVARGFTQIHGIDYEETFSPTTRFTSIRALLQKATNENLILHQLDVKGAYLHAPIDKEIYIQQPPGYETSSDSNVRLSCRLRKSLYGLKQSGRMWYETLTDFLKSHDFVANSGDPCLYTRGTVNTSDYIVLIFWVDDIIIGSQSTDQIESTKLLLHDRFKMDDRGQLQWFLGIDFVRLDDGRYQINQRRYAEQILKRFNMSDCKSIDTPCGSGIQLQKATEEEYKQVCDSNFPYREVVGSLIYLMTATRPDISWTVSKLSQFLDKPGPPHVTAAKRLLRYIKGTLSYSITYTPTDGVLVGYADSDWAGDTDDRRSTTGYVFTLGSSPISWKTRKQNTVALSSCEAEYMALSDATKEMLHLRSFCISLSNDQPETNNLYVDNQGAIALAKGNGTLHARSKHIDIRYHFVREQTNITYEHIDSSANLADIMTKPLDKLEHATALKLLRL